MDAQLYNGFFSDADRAAMKIGWKPSRVIYRHWISLLLINELKNCCSIIGHATSRGRWDYAEQQRWLEHRRQVFTPEFLQGYAEEIQMLAQQYADDKEKSGAVKSALAVRGRDRLKQ
ncbi:exodeoxyribonuclease I [Escherichia coli]|uniref:Exodeoxyribonuclease I n=1 Tax=Escherichia coli TaxID=562 RepID=A0A376S929_ECOLX|nr:exodeoxyribonuclease I [Escherichia coli]